MHARGGTVDLNLHIWECNYDFRNVIAGKTGYTHHIRILSSIVIIDQPYRTEIE